MIVMLMGIQFKVEGKTLYEIYNNLLHTLLTAGMESQQAASVLFLTNLFDSFGEYRELLGPQNKPQVLTLAYQGLTSAKKVFAERYGVLEDS